VVDKRLDLWELSMALVDVFVVSKCDGGNSGVRIGASSDLVG
jgi:hypothetical protein